MPVSLPSFPTAPSPSTGETLSAAMPMAPGAACSDAGSFDEQMAALSGPAPDAVAVPLAGASNVPVASSAAVRMRGAVTNPEGIAPEILQEADALCESGAVQVPTDETAGPLVDEADPEVDESDDASESDTTEPMRPDPLIACFIALPQPVARPVDGEVSCSCTETADVVSSDTVEGRPSSLSGSQSKQATGMQAWDVSSEQVLVQSDASQPGTFTSRPSVVARPVGKTVSESGQAWPAEVAGVAGQTSAQIAMPSGSSASRVSTTTMSGTAPVPAAGKDDLTEVDAVAAAERAVSSGAVAVAGSQEGVANRDSVPANLSGLGANSAEGGLETSETVRSTARVSSERKILNAGGKSVASEQGLSGIAGAKRYRAMISDITTTAGSLAPRAEQAISGALSASAQGMQASDVAAQEALAPVSKAFEVVQEAVEKLKASSQNVVEVNMADGADSQLRVRIEYRDGVVHTSFRTDSPELREQLTRDWQASMTNYGASDTSVRLADPVFSSPVSASRDSNLDLGGQFARQQQQSQQSSSQTTSFAGGLRHASSGTSSATTSSTAAAATPQAVRPETARYLHTLA